MSCSDKNPSWSHLSLDRKLCHADMKVCQAHTFVGKKKFSLNVSEILFKYRPLWAMNYHWLPVYLSDIGPDKNYENITNTPFAFIRINFNFPFWFFLYQGELDVNESSQDSLKYMSFCGVKKYQVLKFKKKPNFAGDKWCLRF